MHNKSRCVSISSEQSRDEGTKIKKNEIKNKLAMC